MAPDIIMDIMPLHHNNVIRTSHIKIYKTCSSYHYIQSIDIIHNKKSVAFDYAVL